MYSSSKLPLHVRVMLTTIKGSIIQFLGTLHVGIVNTLWQFSKQISKIFFQLSVQVHFFSWPNWKREEGLSWRVEKGGHIELFLKKSQTGEPMIHVNSTWVSLEYPWKFHFFFNWPREFPYALSPIPQEIPCPQYPLFVFFSEIAQLRDYLQEHSDVIRDEKVSPFLKFEIVLLFLCFLLDPLTNKHCKTWSSMINLWINPRTY